MRVLLVEDNKILGDGVRAGLRQREFVVDWVSSAEEAQDALDAAGDDAYGAMVLDIGLPGISGLEFLRNLRKRKLAFPVLILTARDTVDDRVKGLDSGADDYLIKPFSIEELAARLRALTRRSQGRISSVISHGQLQLDPASHLVTLKGKKIELTPKEFAILKALLENAGRVQSRERLEEQLYGWNDELESNAVEVHIHHLRKKLGAEWVRTIRGVGYMVEEA